MKSSMPIITDTSELTAFCKRAAAFPYITVDTEFMREKTYWPRLCLVQVGTPAEAMVIDALPHGIDLSPLFELLADQSVLKVFHAARQDIEIFVNLTGQVPSPLFDTQIAAMVCGYGDSVGYERLVRDIARKSVDKTMRFTDWSRRPLGEKQIDYALGDVTHLRKIYTNFAKQLEDSGRAEWLSEEMEVLKDPATYLTSPEDAWKRLKTRSRKPRYLANVQALAAWREATARENDIPRSRVLKDESITEIAAHTPASADELIGLRAVRRDRVGDDRARELIGVLDRVRAMGNEELPEPPPERPHMSDNGSSTELLKVLLKLKCDNHKVAQKLVASSGDIEAIAADDNAEVRALAGWRRDIFGEDALRLKHGQLALTAEGSRINIIETPD
ncbi:MAG: ribonuclease D [Pseudomonadota bacterium]|nr:ribonuclease D [Pseudomonadota bacterium]